MTSPDTEALVGTLSDNADNLRYTSPVLVREAATTIQSLTATIDERAKEIERLKDENHNLGNEIDALEEEGCAADDTIRAAESRVSALSAEVGRLRLPEGTLAKHGYSITIEFDSAEYAIRAFDALEYAMSEEPGQAIDASLNGGSDHD